ncbi:glycosyltransferase family 4 protein [Bradyrhizobium canariense]|uniref:Glycosyltransferase involved in cell wall bisynthesis n=1 Tax=Bradyrhizobium canariense TaxID=255045 RepID=A0A1H2BN88_9BRAD|nr:glycosyltransferase family 4 protein [Bradyrhizobium canariense]SDT59527.1 Glycosyltransferase involved in cell wall bisynthesis [Bradyrhizobium canariense]
MKRTNGFSRVIFIGQFPPPVNGLTFITQRLGSALSRAGYDVATINTTGPAGNRSIFFHAARIAKISRALVSIAWNALSGRSRVCYFTAEGGHGLIYSVMIASWARLFRVRIYIHHHSFSYIVRWQPLMKLLLARSGAKAVHIFLSSGMAQDLANRYGQAINSLVVSNAAFVDAAALQAPSLKTREITIGLLSNLTADKGLYEFLQIVRVAKQRSLPIHGVLAGPVARNTDKIALEAAKLELGEYLDYRGPVYDGEKARFFKDVDVFVFLTSYLNEAQPTVLFEAMAQGIPVISYDRGCIRAQVAGGGHVFPEGGDIVSEVLKILEGYCQDPDCLATEKNAALSQFEDERRTSQERVASLFEATPEQVVALNHESQ